MEQERTWMYSSRYLPGRVGYKEEWETGVEQFITFACSNPGHMDGNKIRCPCRRCKNLRFKDCDDVRVHLYKCGFMPSYTNWTAHGEPFKEPSDQPFDSCGSYEHAEGSSPVNPYAR